MWLSWLEHHPITKGLQVQFQSVHNSRMWVQSLVQTCAHVNPSPNTYDPSQDTDPQSRHVQMLFSHMYVSVSPFKSP